MADAIPEEIEERLFGDGTAKEEAPAVVVESNVGFESTPEPLPTVSADASGDSGDDFESDW